MLVELVLLCALFAVPVIVWVHHDRLSYPATAWIGLGAAIGIIFFFIVMADNTDPTLRLNLRLTSRTRRRRLAFGLAFGLVPGLAPGLVLGLVFGLGGEQLPPGGDGHWAAVGVSVLAAGLAAGLVMGLSSHFSLAVQPTTVMRQNLAYVLVAGLAIGLTTGVGVWLLGGSAVGLTGGLASGVAVGLGMGLLDWIRYLIGCSLARRKGMLPRQVGHFLDWAYRANLLRMSGTAAQFRHRELQVWLTSPHQGTAHPDGRKQKAVPHSAGLAWAWKRESRDSNEMLYESERKCLARAVAKCRRPCPPVSPASRRTPRSRERSRRPARVVAGRSPHRGR
jgi:hypothetical protein